MKRDEFEHVVRAAGAILGENEILVIGSQSLHGSVDHPLPPEAERSVEVDVAALEHSVSKHTTCGSRRRSPIRPQDIGYCAALLKAGIIRSDELEARMSAVRDLDASMRETVLQRLRSD